MLIRPPTRLVRDWYCDSRRWEGYRPRAGDVVIATAPKVGTTWTQQIVSLLIFQSPEPRDLMQLSPWIESRSQSTIEEALARIEAQTHRRFLKSHLPLDALPIFEEVRYIHVARDGRDACMSFLNHFNSYLSETWARYDAVGMADETIGRPLPRPPKTPRAFFHYWLGAGGEGGEAMMAGAFFAIERSFWAARKTPNLLLVHYNDLKADLASEMKRIAAFLGIAIPEGRWPALVEAATLEAMKRDGGVLLSGLGRGFRDGHETFLHSGANDRWRGVLTEEELAAYDQAARAALTPGLRSWLEAGGRVAGDPRAAPD